MKLERFRAEGPIATVFGAVNTGSWRQEYPMVDYVACIKCGTCQRYCPVDAITISGRSGRMRGICLGFL